MQLIHELSWLWKGIGIIALASAIVLIAAFKLHKEEYKIEIACIIFIVTILIGIIAMILCSRVPMPISAIGIADCFLSLRYHCLCTAGVDDGGGGGGS